MKNARLIILGISVVVLIAALLVGLIFPATEITLKQPTVTQPTTQELPILPERVPSIPQGKYYCVAGTPATLDIPRDYNSLANGSLPSLTIGRNNLFVASCGNDIMGYYQYDGKTNISFTEEDAAHILQLYPLEQLMPPISGDDEGDIATPQPTDPPILTCTYDNTTQILHFTYDTQSITLRYFPTDEAATQWYQQHSVNSIFTFLSNYNDYQQFN